MASLPNLKQIRAFVAVCEVGSFTAAARRENATQSGISQHIAGLEAALGYQLLNRDRDAIVPTRAGKQYYDHCVDALQALRAGQLAVESLDGELTGSLQAGLMPAFTRNALAPALERFVSANPGVAVQVTEAYSGALTQMVRSGQLDFALVPAAAQLSGLRSQLFSRDTEMLVCSPQFAVDHHLKPMQPVKLAKLGPIDLVVPAPANARRGNLQQYLDTNGIRVNRMIEMDAMLGTLELVARSDWVTILPSVILANDYDGQHRVVCPLADPPMSAEFVVIEPASRPVSEQARLFLAELRNESERIVTVPNPV